jgi:hypothetical protein
VVFQGCAPNFWKQQSHLGCWPAPYTPSTVVSTVFTIPGCLTGCTYGRGKNAVNIVDLTFTRALGLGSASGARADLCARAGYLLREGVAALLNAQNTTISFPLTTTQIVADVNAALASCDPQEIRDLGNQLRTFNRAGCPLNARSCGLLTVPFPSN